MNIYNRNNSIKDKLIQFILCALVLATLGVLQYIIMRLLSDFGFELPQKTSRFNNVVDTKNILKLIVLVVFVGPLIEELLFRSWLQFTKVGFMIFFAVVIYLGFKHIRYDYCLLSLLILLNIWFVFYKSKRLKKIKELICFLPNNIKLSFLVLSSLLFGFSHLYNYQEISMIVLVICIIKVLAGFVLGYLRIKSGLIWSIALHVLINFIPISFLILR